MPKSEYQELIAFLGRKFDGVDTRFAQVDARLDQMATTEELQGQQAETREYIEAKFGETRRHFEVVAEGLRGQAPLLAGGTKRVWSGRSGYWLGSSEWSESWAR
jgi:hypothetical protein